MDQPKLTYTPADLLEKTEQVPYPSPYFHKVTVTVEKVNGLCPVVVEGDKLVFDLTLLLDESEISSDLPNYFENRPQICMTAVETVYKYVKPLVFGVSAKELGITTDGEDGFVMCAAWGPPTCEAAIIFRLHPEPIEKGWLDRWYETLAREGHISVPTMFFDRFAPSEAHAERERLIEEWDKAGRPKFWEGWDNNPHQPRRTE